MGIERSGQRVVLWCLMLLETPYKVDALLFSTTLASIVEAISIYKDGSLMMGYCARVGLHWRRREDQRLHAWPYLECQKRLLIYRTRVHTSKAE